jgi:signal transduction histidine kinase
MSFGLRQLLSRRVPDRNTPNESSTFLAIRPASPAARRCALAIVIALFAAFCGLIPYARVPQTGIEKFIPVFDSTVALNDLMTAGLLIVGFSRSRLRAVLVLATGYLFAALVAIAHMLASLGVFTSGDLIDARSQTSAWLQTFGSAAFPLFVISYAQLKRYENQGEQSRPSTRTCWIISAAITAVAGVCLLSLLATAGHLLWPRIATDSYTSAITVVNATALLFSLTSLVILGSRFPYSILDLWLLVVIFASIPDMILSAVSNTGYFDIGFALGHLYGLFAAIIVPIVLLVEASRIATRLDEALAVAEERNVQLARSREELAQAQRLEAIGQLTGGVAHDFNNLLTVVIGNLELILGAGGDAKIERLARAAMNAARRGEHLVRQLLTYALKQINRPQTVNLNQLITNVRNLMQPVIGEQIEVVTILSPVLATVQIDAAQFETAILNLTINSRDAMPAGGRITIETADVIVDETHTATDPEIPPGAYVMVAVSDSGTGMTSAVLARAFDPFFTTKEVGKGSGLGLSQVYGFAKTAAGHVKIDSELGVGTIVRLYLPQSANRDMSMEPGAETASSHSASDRGRILVVEDDEEVLAVTSEGLRELGYEVVTSGNAARALEILAGDQRVDLLFSDVIMPGGINGAQLAVRARHLRPDLKVLLTSGYTAAALSLEHGLPDNLEIVGKPYQREELAKTLRLVIGAEG